MEPDIIICIRCGAKKELLMFAHRVDNCIVGWVFSCFACKDKVKNMKLNIDWKSPKH